MNVLITGGAGYIGSHVALEYLKENCKVTLIDNLELGNKNLVPDSAELVICDISDEREITKLIKEKKFDIAIHLAAYTKVGESVKNPEKYFNNNYTKAIKFFDICVKNNLKKFIFSSTGAVYGNSNSKNFLESDTKNPINPYSESKLKTENYLKSLSNKKDVQAISLRYFNVAGSDSLLRSGLVTNPDNLIKAICEFIVGKRDEFIVNGNNYNTPDGTTIRDFIHVVDLANIHYMVSNKLLENKNHFYDVYNCGYGAGYSVMEILKKFEEIIQHKINFKIGKRREGDAEISVANVTKLSKDFLWKPKFNNLKVILESSLAWEKKIKL